MQHTEHWVRKRSVADEVPDTHLLHGCPEGIDVGAMEGRLDAPSDCLAVQSCTHVGAGNPVPDGRHSAAGKGPFRKGADADRERGDLRRDGGRPIDSFGCCAARASAINSQPRDQAKRRPIRLSGHRGRQRCLGSCASSEALQTGQEHSLGSHRDGQASAAVVAGTDCRMAQPYSSATRASTCPTRPSTAASSFKRVAP
jgi:hypothetical protein